jgi:hypothetical protein
MLTLQESGWLQFYIDNNTIPILSTTLLEGLLPGLVETYGKDVPMGIYAKTTEFPQAIFNPGQLGANVSVDFNFEVIGNGTAVVLSFIDTIAMMQLTLTNFTLVPQLKSIKFNDIEASQSQIGDIDTASIKSFLNLAIRMGLPVVNKFL